VGMELQWCQYKQQLCSSTIWEQEDVTGNDTWCKFHGAIENFNHIRKLDILSSEKYILDESMSAYRPCTSKYRGLHIISM
jgi:hypothetical protein